MAGSQLSRPLRFIFILILAALGTGLAAVGGWRYARASAPVSGPIIVISDNLGLNFGSLSNQVGRPVVLASGGSEMGYKVALKLCELMIEDRAAAALAAA